MTKQEAVEFLERKDKEYKTSKITSLIFSAVLATAAMTLSTFAFDHFGAKKSNDTIEQKITELEDIGTSLDQLKRFMDEQKDIIINQEKTIQKLQSKNKELEPIVNSNQETVDAIMAEAERSAKKSIWKERFIGLIFGIIGSLIATYILSRLKKPKK